MFVNKYIYYFILAWFGGSRIIGYMTVFLNVIPGFYILLSSIIYDNEVKDKNLQNPYVLSLGKLLKKNSQCLSLYLPVRTFMEEK